VRSQGIGVTDVGRRRKNNQDAFAVDNDLGLFIVADGMGGHASGEIASEEAVDAVRSLVGKGRPTLAQISSGDDRPETLRAAVRLMESALQNATYMVFGIAQYEPDQQGMGTTVSALVVAGNYGLIGQVGDSRVYLIRDGVAAQLTTDHTLVAWQVRQGIITPEEAAVSPHRNVITRAVGSREYVQVDTRFVPVLPGDAFLLCSDGLHGYCDEGEIAEIVASEGDNAAQIFVDISNARGGRDNITAVVVRITE